MRRTASAATPCGSVVAVRAQGHGRALHSLNGVPQRVVDLPVQLV